MKGFGGRFRLRRRRLIEQLAEAGDSALALFFDDPVVGLLIIDRQGQIVRANETFARMISSPAALAAGMPAAGVFDPAIREHILAEISASLKSGRPGRELTARFLKAEGEPELAVQVSIVPIREQGGTISGLRLGFVDVSVQKRLEAQLAHSQKLQAVGQLAGGIAHDFNNLLTAIMGAAEVVLAHPRLDLELVEDVVQISASAERGAALVRQLLAFGRQQTLSPRIVAVNEAIRGIAQLLRPLLGEKVRIVLDLESPGRMIEVDPSQFDQVLVNLAMNARDAMEAGGTLTLRSGHITLFRPLVRGEETIPPGRYVMIEVQDNGEGILPELLPRIFDPFFTTKKERGGHGLGLSMVHGIVRQSGGFLAIESVLGQGTRMRIYLPRYDGEAMGQSAVPLPAATPPSLSSEDKRTILVVGDGEEEAQRLRAQALERAGFAVLVAKTGEEALALLARQRQETPQSQLWICLPRYEGEATEQLWPLLSAATPPSLSGESERTVLVVEDEEGVRRLALRALERAGFATLAAETGEEALALLARQRQETPKLELAALVSDVVMPGMDGLAVVRAVRGEWPGLPAILVSGYAEESLRAEMKAEEVVFLAKPYTMKGLVREVEALLAGGSKVDARDSEAHC